MLIFEPKKTNIYIYIFTHLTTPKPKVPTKITEYEACNAQSKRTSKTHLKLHNEKTQRMDIDLEESLQPYTRKKTQTINLFISHIYWKYLGQLYEAGEVIRGNGKWRWTLIL